MDFHPGKKGGRYDLPGDAKLLVGEGHFGKKDVVSVALIPPNKRHEYCPQLAPYERLASNVYLIHAKPDLKAPVGLQLTSALPDMSTVVALQKTAEDSWQPVVEVEQNKATLTINTRSSGAFVLVSQPPTETFEVTPNGGMHNSKIHHLISLRVPKRCTNYNGSCVLKIFKIEEDRISKARALFPRDTSDIDRLSPFYDFSFPGAPEGCEFKRPITVKLPLPDWCEQLSAEAASATSFADLVVMSLQNGAWEALEAPLKVSKATVSFDCRHLTRFCLVRPRKDRRMRLHLSMPRLEASNAVVRGEILLFAMLETRAWHLWAECTPQAAVVDTISTRVKKGFTFLKKLPVAPPEPEEENARFNRSRQNRRRSDRSPRRKVVSLDDKQPEDVELQNGRTFLLSLEGGLRFQPRQADDSQDGAIDAEIAANTVHLQFHELFEDNYRCVAIEPREELREKAEEFFLARVAKEREEKAKEKEEEKAKLLTNGHSARGAGDSREAAYNPPLPSPTEFEAPLNGDRPETEEEVEKEMAKLVFNTFVSLRAAPSCSDPEPAVVARFPLSVDADDLVDFFALEAPPERDLEAEAAALREEEALQMEAAAASAAAEQAAKAHAEQSEKKAKAKAQADSFNRLTTTTKKPAKIIKESKVLTGRSLQILSRYVPHGLTLAVHLNLPDSVITGIGFDSLSNLHCLNDVTYKVLLHWKRTYGTRDKDQMVPDLCAALKAMEMIDMAAVIADRHRNNTELSPGCFDY